MRRERVPRSWSVHSAAIQEAALGGLIGSIATPRPGGQNGPCQWGGADGHLPETGLILAMAAMLLRSGRWRVC